MSRRDPAYFGSGSFGYSGFGVLNNRWEQTMKPYWRSFTRKICNTNVAPHATTGIRYPDYSESQTIYGVLTPRDRSTPSFAYGRVPMGVDSFITIDPLFFMDLIQDPKSLDWWEVSVKPREEFDEKGSFAYRWAELHLLPFWEE